MAQGKNKIFVYKDWLNNFEDLTDEELGKIMRHFFEYVNDLNPVLEDRLLNLVWKPIESTLKRDLKKWEEKSEKNRESARMRWDKNNANAYERKKRNAKHADRDRDRDKDRDSDILLEKETKELFKTWLDYRKEIKKPIKSQRTKTSLAKKMQKEGFEKSKRAVDQSIQNSWQGLFWSKETELKTIVTNR